VKCAAAEREVGVEAMLERNAAQLISAATRCAHDSFAAIVFAMAITGAGDASGCPVGGAT